MALQFSENRQRSIGLSVTANPRTVLSSVGLQEATEAETLAGTVQNRYISPLRLTQKLDADFLEYADQSEAEAGTAPDKIMSPLRVQQHFDFAMDFQQPSQFPINITSGHIPVYADSDAQFGNAYSNYPLGAVSAYPTITGKAGSSIGSSAVGQTFSVRFQWAANDITITYTAIGGDTTATIAAALCTAINANATIHDASTGQPVFAQSFSGSATFNLQYIATLSATGATPLTTTSTGTGTVTLASEINQLDYVVMQLGRSVSGRAARAGDSLYALDFTGQDSTGSFNTHYAQIGVTAQAVTSGAVQGRLLLTIANGGSTADGVCYWERGYVGYDSAGAIATGGDQGFGTINLPAAGGYFIDGAAIPRANVDNTFTALQRISLTTAGNNLVLISTDAGAGAGPILTFDRNSATPAASDANGLLLFQGRDSAGNATQYGRIQSTIIEPANGSEYSLLTLSTLVTGAQSDEMVLGGGVIIGNPTGGLKGFGTLNMDSDVYRDNTKVLGTRATGWTAWTGTAARGTQNADAPPTTTQLAQALKALIDDLISHGIIGT